MTQLSGAEPGEPEPEARRGPRGRSGPRGWLRAAAQQHPVGHWHELCQTPLSSLRPVTSCSSWPRSQLCPALWTARGPHCVRADQRAATMSGNVPNPGPRLRPVLGLHVPSGPDVAPPARGAPASGARRIIRKGKKEAAPAGVKEPSAPQAPPASTRGSTRSRACQRGLSSSSARARAVAPSCGDAAPPGPRRLPSCGYACPRHACPRRGRAPARGASSALANMPRCSRAWSRL